MNEFIASTHPFVVHFAVALTIMSALFDLASLFIRRQHLATTGFSLAVTAVPFLLLAVLSGNLAEIYLSPELASTHLEEHKLFANITVWSFTALALWRAWLAAKKRYAGWQKILYVALVLAAGAATFYTAERGGAIFHTAAPERGTGY